MKNMKFQHFHFAIFGGNVTVAELFFFLMRVGYGAYIQC